MSAGALLLPLAVLGATPDSIESSAVVRAMKDEMERTMGRLELPGMPKPYYVGQTITDFETVTVSATLGAVVRNEQGRARALDVELRVGDRGFDNTNFFGQGSFFGTSGFVFVSMDDDYDAIRHSLWKVTDGAYKNAVETLERKRAAEEGRQDATDDTDDFSEEKPATVIVSKEPPDIESSGYAGLVKRLSTVFLEQPDIQFSEVTLSAQKTRRYFVSSEGSLSYQPKTIVRLDIACRAQADDGMIVKSFTTRHATSLAGLGTEAELMEAARTVAREVKSAREAAVVEDYSGPVLFEGRAAAQVMRALLEDNVSGTPLPFSDNPQMMQRVLRSSEIAGKIGKKVMPAGFGVFDDPGLSEYAGKPLIGGYEVDAEGVPAQKVVLVQNGVLESLLMSRTPRKEIAKSNGHGRSAIRGSAKGRIGNLIVQARRGKRDKALRKALVRQAKKAGHDHGIVVRLLDEPGITGHDEDDMMSFFMRGPAAATPVSPPLVAYKVGADGKEEPVRGLRIQPLQMRALREIAAAGKDANVLNYEASILPAGFGGFGGGEMSVLASIPSAVVSPSLLFEEIEVKKVQGPFKKPPLLDRP